MKKIKYAIVDLDGTVANCEHRLHLVKNKPKNFKKFYSLCGDDIPIYQTIQIIELLHEHGVEIIFSTGRSVECITQTIEWLQHNFSFEIKSLYMRNEKDYRSDYVVKKEFLDSMRKIKNVSPHNTIIFEDRNQVVDMYRELDYQVYQVNNGNF